MANIPVQPVTPLMPPHQDVPAFQLVRDLDRQHHQCFDQTVTKHQPSPLEDEHCKRAKPPPQPDLEDAPSREQTRGDRHAECERGHSLTRKGNEKQKELDRARTKSTACSKSRAHGKSSARSKSKASSKSRARSKSKACHKNDTREERGESKACPDRKGSHTSSPVLPTHSYEQLRVRNCHDAEHLAPSAKEQSKHDKLKEEVTKRPHEYICRCTLHIAYTLTCKDNSVKCLLAFGTNALKYAAEILAIIELGTQHWRFQEPFPVLPVPKWLCMPEMMQTTTPLRGELPLPSPAIPVRDIPVRGPTLWPWMAVLLQYWQDHIS